jgi:DNA polymerase-3 subunit epsilon
MAPVLTAGAPAGFVLLIDDFTEEHAAQSRRDRTLLELTEAGRASVASMQAALDMLELPDLEAAERDRFLAVVRDEAARLGERLAAAAQQELAARWPLQEMHGADLVAAARRRIEAETGQPVAADPDPALWLRVDSFGLIQALAYLAGRLAATLGRPALGLRLTRAGARARLDLSWSGEAAPEAAAWQTAPIQAGGLTVRDVAERHGGEVWLERSDGPCFRFLLPLAGEPEAVAAASRPEFYDFDLFAASEASRDLDGRPLAQLAYTVFDTETTGLDPAEDEIIQIGAARIVNGRLLRGECFDQLVDPGRSIPEAGISIHGIRPEMVRGAPGIAAALPAFHAFARDTVLVGHNVAFDLRFMALKEAATGLRFDHPVLDTLLLSSVVHPDEEAHALEAIAGRLGLAVTRRHSALGDALTTAEVFLKLVPLLAQRGVVTLGEARKAAASSYYARLRY